MQFVDTLVVDARPWRAFFSSAFREIEPATVAKSALGKEPHQRYRNAIPKVARMRYQPEHFAVESDGMIPPYTAAVARIIRNISVHIRPQ